MDLTLPLRSDRRSFSTARTSKETQHGDGLMKDTRGEKPKEAGLAFAAERGGVADVCRGAIGEQNAWH